ncbi:GNAT family N-acetyltransferase [Nocardia sp. NPDC020380]|uniref:GNAT family N-acetyltransferase n=1 Tax=Nocardia sp. NPDC020380 TaxID=3364309 RepID=UPI0037A99BBA
MKPSSAVIITRVAELQWHALEDDRVIGRGEASRRPDGRLFLSIDAWHDAVFDRIAAAMLPDLPRPLYTVVDEVDRELLASWERAGLLVRRREWEYLVPTDPEVTGLGEVSPPEDVTIVNLGAAQMRPLQELDCTIRAEIDATVGWQSMPAEMLTAPADPSKYAVAAESGEYVALVRVVQVHRLPRIGLLAVRSDRRRRGLARALLAQVLGGLHSAGIDTASCEVDESNTAALALFDSIGGRRVAANLELVCR